MNHPQLSSMGDQKADPVLIVGAAASTKNTAERYDFLSDVIFWLVYREVTKLLLPETSVTFQVLTKQPEIEKVQLMYPIKSLVTLYVTLVLYCFDLCVSFFLFIVYL